MLDVDYMRRALELAEAGRGLTSPNPMVGAVLVRDGAVVGEGSHTYAGLYHAEAIALAQAGARTRAATLYINLEPCSHQGRTPPCAEALVGAGIARVVAGMPDPNPLVAGRGFERLRQSGIAVEVGLLEADCRRLNEHFSRYIQGGVFVTLKAAMTLDGRIATGSKVQSPKSKVQSQRFTSPESLAYVHRLRHAHDAIITGIGTVLADAPLLTDRCGLPRRRSLLRVVLDSHLRLPLDSRLVQPTVSPLVVPNPNPRASSPGHRDSTVDLLVICGSTASEVKAAALRNAGVEVVTLLTERPEFADVLRLLRAREVTSVLVEAGSELNAAAMESGLVDKLVLFYAPMLAGGDAPPMLAGPGFPAFDGAPTARISSVRQMGCDVMVEAYLRELTH